MCFSRFMFFFRREPLPNLKSAKKRMRQDIKRRDANRQKKSAIRTTEKKVRSFVAEKKFDEAAQSLQVYSSLIDRAAKSNLYHKNAAARKKARLSKLIATQAKS